MIEIEHLRIMANNALTQYGIDTFAGGEPIYPQWAEDMLKVCDQAAYYEWFKQNAKAGSINCDDWSIDAGDMDKLDIAIRNSMQRKV